MAALQDLQEGDRRLSLDVAYGRLPTDAARVLRLLPVHPGPDASAATVAALANLPVSDSREALTCLVRAGLAEVVAGSGERWRITGSVRPLVQRLSRAFARSGESEDARNRLLDYLLTTTEAAGDRLRGRPPIPVVEEFTARADALAWLDAERVTLLAAVQMAVDTGRNQAAMALPLLMADYLGFREQFHDLLAMTMISLDIARRLGDRAVEGDALTDLGLALYGLQRYDEAESAHRQAAAVFREVGNRDGEGDALNNLGLTLHSLHRDDDAESAHREAAAVLGEVGDRHGEANALNNLGLTLHSLHRDDDAESAYREAASIFLQTGDRHSEAKARGNLGNVLQELGRYSEAVSAYQKAADILRDIGDRCGELRMLEILDLIQEMS
jgi:tetratricopeptide (TPR) repeat protein